MHWVGVGLSTTSLKYPTYDSSSPHLLTLKNPILIDLSSYIRDEDTLIGISLHPTRNSCSGAKRWFLDAIDGCCGMGGGVNGSLKSQGCASEAVITKDIVVAVLDRDEGSSEWEMAKNDRGSKHGTAAPAAKAQIVGWPPIRSFRKNTTASALAKSNEDVEGKSAAAGCLHVKVSMDGVPYLHKVDLKNYRTYAELLTALEQMFS